MHASKQGFGQVNEHLIIAATASIIYFANFEEIIKKMHKSERRTNFMGVHV